MTGIMGNIVMIYQLRFGICSQVIGEITELSDVNLYKHETIKVS